MTMTTTRPITPSLDDALAAYLRTLTAANKSAATITAYRADLKQFLAFLAETNGTIATPAAVQRADVTAYLADLADRGRSGLTRARKLAALREWFRFLHDEGVIAKNPTQGIATPKKERAGRTTLRPDEYTKLLSLAGANPHDYAILQVYLQTGLRVSELCSLTLDDIDLASRTLHVRHGKGQHARTIELEKKGIQAIRSYLAVRPNGLHRELFLNYQGGPLSDRGVRKMLAKYLTAAGTAPLVWPRPPRQPPPAEMAAGGKRPAASALRQNGHGRATASTPALQRRSGRISPPIVRSWHAARVVGRGKQRGCRHPVASEARHGRTPR